MAVEWCILPFTWLSSCRAAAQLNPGRPSEVLRLVTERVLEAPGVAQAGPEQQGAAFSEATEAVFTLAFDSRPHERHARALEQAGLNPSLPSIVRGLVLDQLARGERVVCPSTTEAALDLLKREPAAVITADLSAMGSMASLDAGEAEGACSGRDGVVGCWWSGSWKLDELVAASAARQARI